MQNPFTDLRRARTAERLAEHLQPAWDYIDARAEAEDTRPVVRWYYDRLLAERGRADRKLERRFAAAVAEDARRPAPLARHLHGDNRAARRAKAARARSAQRFADRECAAYMAKPVLRVRRDEETQALVWTYDRAAGTAMVSHAPTKPPSVGAPVAQPYKRTGERRVERLRRERAERWTEFERYCDGLCIHNPWERAFAADVVRRIGWTEWLRRTEEARKNMAPYVQFTPARPA